jgi:hypothetical protein
MRDLAAGRRVMNLAVAVARANLGPDRRHPDGWSSTSARSPCQRDPEQATRLSRTEFSSSGYPRVGDILKTINS